MRKKILIGVTGIFFLLLVITTHLVAQKIPQQGAGIPQNFDIIANLQSIQTQLTALSSRVETPNKQILNKLDRILSNQENIIKELAIIKIRASRPH
jgi:predicted PurR-regulated permease PerM